MALTAIEDFRCAYAPAVVWAKAGRRLANFIRRRIFVFFVAMNFWWFGAVALSQALTVATYNVENYVVADRMVDGVFRPAYPKPEKEKAALVQAIVGLAPDILAVQEMGPQNYLDDFQRELKRAGQDYPFTALLEAADPDRHVAVLSKVPFKEVRRHAQVGIILFGKKEVVKRGVLEAVFATTAGDFSLFVVHLKSRRTERKDDPAGVTQRSLEAEAVRDLVLARFPDPKQGLFLLGGDWNDSPDQRPVRALQKRGETKVGQLLRATDSRGEVWTHYYRREDSYNRIDYLLASAALLPAVDSGQASIWDGPGVGAASDHRPVYVRLKLDAIRP